MTNNTNDTFKIIIALCFVVPILSMANDAAFASGSEDIIGATLCNIVANLTGGIAKSIATVAIFAVGVGLFMGKLNWGTAFVTASGVAVVFGAQKILVWLGSGVISNATCTAVG